MRDIFAYLFGIAALIIPCVWLWVFGMASAFTGGVEFPPALVDFSFSPAIYGTIYGLPLLWVFDVALLVATIRTKHAQD